MSEDHQKRVAKEVRDYNSTLVSEFKKESRLMQKEELAVLKYEEKKSKDLMKTLGKRAKDAAKKTFKIELEMHAKFFNLRQEHRTTKFACDCKMHGLSDIDAVKWKFQRLVQLENERNFQEIINLKKKHAEKEYQLNVQAAEELFAVYTESIQLLHPLELSNLKQIHELELVHLGKQQFVEARQQQDLLSSDHKTQIRDFNTKKALDEKRLQNAVKDYKKDNRKNCPEHKQILMVLNRKLNGIMNGLPKLMHLSKNKKSKRKRKKVF